MLLVTAAFPRTFLSAFAFLVAGALLPAAEVPSLIANALLLPCDPSQPASFTGYLATNAQGRILAMGQGAPLDSLVKEAGRVLDVEGKMVAPGFISAHSHLYMSPLRGLGHDETLYGWFRSWDRYLKHATADDLYRFTLHGSLDFLRNGIATAYDFTDPGASDLASRSLFPIAFPLPTHAAHHR